MHLVFPPSPLRILAMLSFRMAGPGRDLFYPPSGFIILYVLNGVIKDPAIKTKVKKIPTSGIKSQIPLSEQGSIYEDLGTLNRFALYLQAFQGPRLLIHFYFSRLRYHGSLTAGVYG